MSLYSDGLVTEAGFLSIETPSSLKTRLDRADMAFKRINRDMFTAHKAKRLGDEDFKAWKTWGGAWLRFLEDSEGFLDRIQGLMGGLVGQLEAYERELIEWYKWAEHRGIVMTGPTPEIGEPSKFGRAAPWLLGIGVVAAASWAGWRYLNRPATVPVRLGTGQRYDVEIPL